MRTASSARLRCAGLLKHGIVGIGGGAQVDPGNASSHPPPLRLRHAPPENSPTTEHAAARSRSEIPRQGRASNIRWVSSAEAQRSGVREVDKRHDLKVPYVWYMIGPSRPHRRASPAATPRRKGTRVASTNLVSRAPHLSGWSLSHTPSTASWDWATQPKYRIQWVPPRLRDTPHKRSLFAHVGYFWPVAQSLQEGSPQTCVAWSPTAQQWGARTRSVFYGCHHCNGL